VVKPPTCGPGDFRIAHRAEPALLIPEIAKRTSTPKRCQHVSPFALFEVGFPGRIVRVSFAFDLNVSFDGRATGAVQPHLTGLPRVIACFSKQRPVPTLMPLKVLLSEPAWVFISVSSSCPPPQSMEDDGIDAVENTLADHMPMIVRPTPNFGVEFAISARLQSGIRFFSHLLPASPSIRLMASLPPAGSDTGLPCSAEVTDRLGPPSTPAVWRVHGGGKGSHRSHCEKSR
jgi:hypothetical protein